MYWEMKTPASELKIISISSFVHHTIFYTVSKACCDVSLLFFVKIFTGCSNRFASTKANSLCDLFMRTCYLQSTRPPDATILHVFGSVCINSEILNKRVVDTKPPCFWHDSARCLSMRPSYLQSTRLPDATILHVFGSICIHSKMRNKCVDDTKPPCFWHDWACWHDWRLVL